MSQPGTHLRQRPSPARGPRGCTSLAPGAIPGLCSSASRALAWRVFYHDAHDIRFSVA